MKKMIALAFTVIAVCLILTACSSGNTSLPTAQLPTFAVKEITPTETTEKPAAFEDTLIEVLKIGDSREKADEVFGEAFSVETNENTYRNKYTVNYHSVEIFDTYYMPEVYFEDDKVISYEYLLLDGSEAVTKAAHQELVAHFTSLYGEPYETDDNSCTWYFKDGTTLVTRTHKRAYSYYYYTNIYYGRS